MSASNVDALLGNRLLSTPFQEEFVGRLDMPTVGVIRLLGWIHDFAQRLAQLPQTSARTGRSFLKFLASEDGLDVVRARSPKQWQHSQSRYRRKKHYYVAKIRDVDDLEERADLIAELELILKFRRLLAAEQGVYFAARKHLTGSVKLSLVHRSVLDDKEERLELYARVVKFTAVLLILIGSGVLATSHLGSGGGPDLPAIAEASSAPGPVAEAARESARPSAFEEDSATKRGSLGGVHSSGPPAASTGASAQTSAVPAERWGPRSLRLEAELDYEYPWRCDSPEELAFVPDIDELSKAIAWELPDTAWPVRLPAAKGRPWILADGGLVWVHSDELVVVAGGDELVEFSLLWSGVLSNAVLASLFAAAVVGDEGEVPAGPPVLPPSVMRPGAGRPEPGGGGGGLPIAGIVVAGLGPAHVPGVDSTLPFVSVTLADDTVFERDERDGVFYVSRAHDPTVLAWHDDGTMVAYAEQHGVAADPSQAEILRTGWETFVEIMVHLAAVLEDFDAPPPATDARAVAEQRGEDSRASELEYSSDEPLCGDLLSTASSVRPLVLLGVQAIRTQFADTTHDTVGPEVVHVAQPGRGSGRLAP